MPLASPLWEIFIAQEQGARPDQQDQCGAWLSKDGRMVFAVLADGAGGHRGGARAAHLAVNAAKTLWEGECPQAATTDFLERASQAAHQSIQAEFAGSSSARSTWVSLIATSEKACWAHSGDSRLYHLANGKIITHTRDHSVAQILVDQGKITPNEVARHPDRSTLLASLGGGDYVPVDVDSITLQGQDSFLLCTDGLWNHLIDDEITAFVNGQPEAARLVSEAVHRAKDDADNTTLLYVKLR